MTSEIPAYAMRAYALFYSRYGSREPFTQSVLDWITGISMKKKIFSVLVKAGWIKKESREEYVCVSPEKAVVDLLIFKVTEIIKTAEKPYAFTQLSAIEIWSDYAYVQREKARSPYFIKIEQKDTSYWKFFFQEHSIPYYTGKGSTIGEFVILVPVKKIRAVQKEGMWVEPLSETIKIAKKNEMYEYAYEYMRKKYDSITGKGKRNL